MFIWTEDKLHAFDIWVASVSGTAQFWQPCICYLSTILNNVQIPPGPISKDDRLFFEYLTDAERASSELGLGRKSLSSCLAAVLTLKPMSV